MWRNILRNTLFGLVILSITSIGIKKFNPTDIIQDTNVKSNTELNQNSVSSRMTLVVSWNIWKWAGLNKLIYMIIVGMPS